jgi:hypothetical protein
MIFRLAGASREQYTYFGPEHETRLAATGALVPGGFTGFADWAKVHMKPT